MKRSIVVAFDHPIIVVKKIVVEQLQEPEPIVGTANYWLNSK